MRLSPYAMDPAYLPQVENNTHNNKNNNMNLHTQISMIPQCGMTLYGTTVWNPPMHTLILSKEDVCVCVCWCVGV